MSTLGTGSPTLAPLGDKGPIPDPSLGPSTHHPGAHVASVCDQLMKEEAPLWAPALSGAQFPALPCSQWKAKSREGGIHLRRIEVGDLRRIEVGHLRRIEVGDKVKGKASGCPSESRK